MADPLHRPVSEDQAEAKACRAKRHRLRAALRRDAEMRIANIRSTPTGRALYRPRIIFGAIIVLAVLGALLIGKLGYTIEDEGTIPRLRNAIESLDALATGLGRYKFQTGVYPTTEQGLKALMEDPGVEGWLGPYLIQLLPDPWGHPYHYERRTDGTIYLTTRGPDFRLGTADDLYPEPAAWDPGTDWTNGWVPVEQRLPDIEAFFERVNAE